MFAFSFLVLLGVATPALAGNENPINVKIALIGISDYVTSGVPHLEGATEGCLAFKKHLHAVMPAENVLAACGNEALSEKFFTNFEALLKSVVPGERLIFAFEGYGSRPITSEEGEGTEPGFFLLDAGLGSSQSNHPIELSMVMGMAQNYTPPDTEILFVLDAVHLAEYSSRSSAEVVDFSQGPNARDFESVVKGFDAVEIEEGKPDSSDHFMVITRGSLKQQKLLGLMDSLTVCIDLEQDEDGDRALGFSEIALCLKKEMGSIHVYNGHRELLWSPKGTKEVSGVPNHGDSKLRPTLQATGLLVTTIALILNGVIYSRGQQLRRDLDDPLNSFGSEAEYLETIKAHNELGKTMPILYGLAGGGAALTIVASIKF